MVGPVHMERLGSIEAIAHEKGVLPASLPPDGVAVLNADDARVAAMSDRTQANVITYGLSPGADVRAEEIESHGLAGVSFTLVHAARAEHVYSHLPGRAMVHNALAAAAVGLVDGMTVTDVAAASDGRARARPLPLAPRTERLDDHRRHLQRQPGVRAGGVGSARRDARPQVRRARRHARTGRR